MREPPDGYAAQGQACGPLDGLWEDGEGVLLKIQGGEVRGPDGGIVELTVRGSVVRAQVGETSFEASLSSDGCLLWDDGTAWRRSGWPASEADASQAPRTVQEDEEPEVVSDGTSTPSDGIGVGAVEQELGKLGKQEPEAPPSPRGPGEFFDFDDLDDVMSDASVHFRPEPVAVKTPEASKKEESESESSESEDSEGPQPDAGSRARPAASGPGRPEARQQPQQPAPGRPQARAPPGQSGPGRPGDRMSSDRSSHWYWQSSQPKPPPEDSTTRRLRDQCQQMGLSMAWCSDTTVMTSLLSKAQEWNRYGICALKDELSLMRVPVGGYADQQRDVILAKLRTVLVWQHLSVQQLQAECARRKIPFDRRSRLQDFMDDSDDEAETKRKEAAEQSDLISRLIQDTYAGAQGPLPANLPMLWTPTHTKGVEPYPAWTGDLPQGWQPQSARPPPPQPSPQVPPQWVPPPRPPPRQPEPAVESSSESDGEPSWWRGPPPGPRVRNVLRTLPRSFRFFGRVPGKEAEKWTDEEITAYFLSHGSKRPQPPPAPEPMALANEAPAEHYAVLGLRPGADAAAVKRAYRKLALQYHPDKNSEERDAANFRRIQEAYEEICQFF